jgi:3-(3-hydroxy-phenyl)propionate hydroxylase
MSDTAARDVYDVAVVGFGPSGATAAGLLGGYGLKTFVCDRAVEVYDKPRAIALDHEILRVFQQLGIVDQVLPFVEPFTPSEYFGVDGQLIKRLTMAAPPYPMGYTPSNVFSQPPVEAALRAHVRALPDVTSELGAEVIGVDQDAELATLRLRLAEGEEHTVRARYVIACDGASSFVRAAVGIELEDLVFDEPWLVVDVRVNEQGLAKLPTTSVQYCEPDRPASFIIGPGNHRRWEISLKGGEDPRHAATPEQTWALLSRWITPADGELWRQASYRFHALVADRWREGRVFVAGDAAHQQPPFLGQGMCQGVRDVANLSWKLRAVLRHEVRGHAANELLDSYGLERKQHVSDLTATIKGIGALICERDVEAARRRDAALLAECDGAVRDTPRQDVLPRLRTGFLGEVPGSARGTLFPQPRLAAAGESRSSRLLDEVTGPGWRLVLAPGHEAESDLTFAQTLGLRVIPLGREGWNETEPILANWFQVHGCRAALVRPDHYVFGTAVEAIELEDLLDDWMQRHGVPAVAS